MKKHILGVCIGIILTTSMTFAQTTKKPSTIPFKAGSDNALYTAYQQYVITTQQEQLDIIKLRDKYKNAIQKEMDTVQKLYQQFRVINNLPNDARYDPANRTVVKDATSNKK